MSAACTATRVRRALSGAGRPMQPALLRRMESRLGTDLGGVRLHEGRAAATAARGLGAVAFTVGEHIVLGPSAHRPGTLTGDRLLTHELVHVAQQREAGGPPRLDPQRTGPHEVEAARVANGPPDAAVDVAVHAPRRVALQEAEEGDAAADDAEVETLPDRAVLLFRFDSDELRQDARVDSREDLGRALALIERHGQLVGDAQRITLHGYASVEGDRAHNEALSVRRAVRVRELLVEAGVEPDHITVIAHGPDDTLEGLAPNRRVEIALAPRATVMEFPPAEVVGVPCVCEGGEGWDDETFRFITSITPFIDRSAAAHGVPALAVAGAIADEYSTQRGARGALDAAQDAVLDSLFEWQIDVDRFFDFHNKLLNALQNDVGPANIKVRTALALTEAGIVAVPGSPPQDIVVSGIIDFLLLEEGTAEMSAGVIEVAATLFGPFMPDYEDSMREAVLVEYFKQGDSLYGRFIAARTLDPHHVPCPGGDGCDFLHNRPRLERAMEAGRL